MNELIKKTLAMMTKEYDLKHPNTDLSRIEKKMRKQKAPRRIYNDNILEQLKRALLE